MHVRAILLLSLIAAVVLSTGPATNAQARGRCNDERPWCATALSPDRRAALLLEAMTFDERLALLAGTQTPNFKRADGGRAAWASPGS